VILENLAESFYYQEAQELDSAAKENEQELILTIGDTDDWKTFRVALQAEMKAEGGCLGDFTQTKKVLKHHGQFGKYNLEATLKYFQANVGPCDCHVLRANLV
jgi:hypothetical protein